MKERLWKKIEHQKDAYSSSWSIKEILLLKIWGFVRLICYKITPKRFFNRWRLFILRIFGAKISGQPFVYPSSIVYAPWLLTMGEKSCLGPDVEIYNLGPVKIGKYVTISKGSLVCNGTHDLTLTNMPLLVGEITIEDNVFIGMRALILPGLKIGKYAVIGAGSVVTKDVDAWTIVGGNPAKVIGKRELRD